MVNRWSCCAASWWMRAGVLAALCLLYWFPAAGPAHAQGSISVKLSPAELTVQPGEAFVLDVVIESSIPLRGAQCGLVFDPALLEVQEVSEGEYFQDWAKEHSSSASPVETLRFPNGQPDNAAGYVGDVGVAVMGQVSGGTTGSGVFLRYHMRALPTAQGASMVALAYPLVADESGQDITDLQVSNGVVQVGKGPFPAPEQLAIPTPVQQVKIPVPQAEPLPDAPDIDPGPPPVRWDRILGFGGAGALLCGAVVLWRLSRRP